MTRQVPMLVIALLASCGFLCAQTPPAARAPEPDPRYKADVLLIAGHPDDDIFVAAYLAKLIEQQHKRVAVIYTTRGNAGGNSAGQEQGAVLGDIREMEARRAIASYGITLAWFLHGADTPGSDVLHSLAAWGHGQALEEMVRLVRLTRPEVIFAHLPAYVVGENHEDHQAAGVLATEAFDLAADPLAFPAQVEAPRNRFGLNNYGEGLRPWQAKKIYFFTDASHFEFLKGKGPEYAATDVSPSRKVPYSRIAAESWKNYETQDGYTEAQLKEFTETPLRLILGKSVVGGAVDADVFEGINSGAIAYAKPRGYEPLPPGVTLLLGGPWAFYEAFWPAHNIEHLGRLYSPEAQTAPGETLWVPLILRNNTDSAVSVSLDSILPAGWTQQPHTQRYEIAPRDDFAVQLSLVAPKSHAGTWQALAWTAESRGRNIGSVTLRVSVISGARQE